MTPRRNSGLHADWEWLRVRGRSSRSCHKAALQQRHQARTPVSKDEENEEWNGDVVLVLDGVVDSHGKVGANQEFDPGYPSQALAVFRGADFILLRFDPVFRSAGKCG